MKTFLIRLLLFIFCLTAVDFAFGQLCGYCAAHAKAGRTRKIEYIAKHSVEDVLIFGSSRAHYHYVPQIINDSLGLKAFNGGMDAHGIYYAYGCLSMILDHYTPKMIFYDIVEDTDMKINRLHDDKNIKDLYHFGSEPSVLKIIYDYSPREAQFIKSSLYKYNETFLNIFKDFLFNPRYPQQDGYTPNFGMIADDYIEEDNQSISGNVSCVWDKNKEEYMRRFIKLCHDRHINLIFFYSPKYNGSSSLLSSQLKRFFEDNNCLFLDYSNDSTFVQNRLYFADPTHLNNIGAEEYTRKIVQVLKPLMSTSSGGKYFDYSLANNERNGQ